LAHRQLDEAVFATCRWPVDPSHEEILARLLQLNLERAQVGATRERHGRLTGE